MLRWIITIFFSCTFPALSGYGVKRTGEPAWKPAPYEILSGHQAVSITKFANLFSGGKNSIVKLAPELIGLKGVKFPIKNGLLDPISVSLRFPNDTRLLVGLFRDSAMPDDKGTFSSIKSVSYTHLTLPTILRV